MTIDHYLVIKFCVILSSGTSNVISLSATIVPDISSTIMFYIAINPGTSNDIKLLRHKKKFFFGGGGSSMFRAALGKYPST